MTKEFHVSSREGHNETIKSRGALCSRLYWYGMTVGIDKWVRSYYSIRGNMHFYVSIHA